MPFKSVQKVTAYLTAGLGLLLLSFSGEIPIYITLGIFSAYIISWWAEEPMITKEKWTRFWNSATIFVFIIQFIRWWTGTGFIASAVQYAAFLQINKLFNRRNQSDYDHILVLSLLHLIGCSILISDIEYGILFLFYVILIPWHLMLGQIRREVELKYLEKKDAESIYNFRRVLRSKRVINGRVLGAMSVMSIPVYFITAIIFIFFPRVGFGLFAGQMGLARKSAGFGDSILLGDLAPIANNPMAVARAEFHGKKPPQNDLKMIHWRAVAYDTYDGTSWLRTLSSEGAVQIEGSVYRLTGMDVSSADVSSSNLEKDFYPIDITLLPIPPKALLIPAESPFLEIPHRNIIKAISQRLWWGPSSEVRYSDPFDSGIMYRVWMKKNFSSIKIPKPFSYPIVEHETKLQKYLQLPQLSEDFKKLAQGFIKDYPDKRQRAIAILNYLYTDFKYSRSEFEKVPEGKNPVDAFLFHWKKGNCEFFSTAMTLLLRATGIPARNVAGFLGGEWNTIGNYFMIRHGDAHSWVEAYFPGDGWVIFDPTPPSSEMKPSIGKFMGTLIQITDILNLAWQKHVIAYDLSRQGEIFKHGISSIIRFYNAISEFRQAYKSFKYRPVLPKNLLLIIGMLIVWFIYFGFSNKKGIIIIKQGKALSPSVKNAENIISLLDAKLEVMGLQRPPSCPPLKHSRIVSSRLQNPATLEEIVRIYNDTRFGGAYLEKNVYRNIIQKIKNLE